ncbi:MAG: hypothetical protein PHN45_00280 [Methylococcales bacterium]|nr:hypothetical protein [Methylococcales bacterium]
MDVDHNNYSDFDGVDKDDEAVARAARLQPTIRRKRTASEQTPADLSGLTDDLPFSQCFLQDDDVVANEERLRAQHVQHHIDAQLTDILTPPIHVFTDDEVSQLVRDRQVATPPNADVAPACNPINMDLPDDKLTPEQVLARKNYDIMHNDDYKYNPPTKFIRQDPHIDKSCLFLPDSDVRITEGMCRNEIERAERQSNINVPNERIQSIKTMILDLHTKFFPRGIDARLHPNPMENLKDVFQLYNIPDGTTPNVDSLDQTYSKLFVECNNLFSTAQKLGMLSDYEMDSRLRRILDRLKTSRELLGNLYANAKCSTPCGLSAETQSSDDHGLWRFYGHGAEEEDPTPYQKLLIYLIEKAQEIGYRRYRDTMMLPIRTEDGIATGAWKSIKTFTEYVLDITSDKVVNGSMWYNLTKDKSNMDAATKYLAASQDTEIPWLVPDRHIFCFKNGMYMSKDERFIPYTDFVNVFPRGPPTACNYFDIAIDYDTIAKFTDYMDIQTPAFDQILNAQNLSVTVKRWVYALFVGRMLYNVGEMDDYQIHPFVKGESNTGKSKLLETISNIFDPHDVGILSNNIEEKFGLSFIAKKFIAIADDVRKTLKLDQSDFQNMASANMVSCPVKHGDPLIVRHWECGVVWSGNEVMAFHDNAGSVSRRLAILLFDHVVEHPDMTLGERLSKEIPLLIMKGNWAYRNILRRYGPQKSVWEIIPREFKEQRTELNASNNALSSFLSSGAIVFGEDKYMPMCTLRDMLMEHAKKAGFQLPTWNPDYYRALLNQRKVTVRTCRKPWPKNQPVVKDPVTLKVVSKAIRKHTSYAIGCEMKSTTDDDNDSDSDDIHPQQQQNNVNVDNAPKT